MEIALSPLWLSFQLALITSILLFIIGVPIAYALSQSRSRYKFLPNSGLGLVLKDVFQIQLVFTFSGLLIGSVIYSFPFMVQPVQAAMENLPKSYNEAAQTMGKTRWEILRFIILPNIQPALLSGLVLSFAHTIGEFGVVLMLGGNIPGVTRVASLAVFDEVESLNYSAAHFYSFILLISSFVIIALTYWLNKKAKLIRL